MAGRAARVADSLAVLMQRETRSQVYHQAVQGIDGLDATTLPVLGALSGGPATASQLAAAIGLDRTVVTRYASRLQASGLLERAGHPTDARATLLDLTPAGRAALVTVRRQLVAVAERQMRGWSAQRAQAFVDDLEVFVERLTRG